MCKQEKKSVIKTGNDIPEWLWNPDVEKPVEINEDFVTPSNVSQYYLAGISSFGACDYEHVPSVYTHISPMLLWINRNSHFDLVLKSNSF